MYDYIKGDIASLTPTTAVIECGGIGYEINITLSDYSELQPLRQAKLLVHEVIREDAWQLYGFTRERERELFRSLIGVSGVGPGTARMILSSLSAAELEQTITGGDARRLKGVKGIGSKTAERIIVDLRDKIKPGDDTLINQPAAASETFDEALAALVMLGFPKAAAQKALDKIFRDDPGAKVEKAIKQALSML